ncbi:hypothetical protein HK100_006033 [Physocladia obscura]|uniref:Sphingomyelin synthase-like domain-containing protein n=1 Tax=Physocladia obscura TaxID=109957 RepID=A0AAD5TAB3_9FUNG|nr:hypothetical protein HK100_006033 [Physocladia obscura]
MDAQVQHKHALDLDVGPATDWTIDIDVNGGGRSRSRTGRARSSPTHSLEGGYCQVAAEADSGSDSEYEATNSKRKSKSNYGSSNTYNNYNYCNYTEYYTRNISSSESDSDCSIPNSTLTTPPISVLTPNADPMGRVRSAAVRSLPMLGLLLPARLGSASASSISTSISVTSASSAGTNVNVGPNGNNSPNSNSLNLNLSVGLTIGLPTFRVAWLWKTVLMFSSLAAIAYSMVLIQMWSDDRVLHNARVYGEKLTPLHDIIYEQFIPSIFKRVPLALVDAPISAGLLSSLLFSAYTNRSLDPFKTIRRSLFILNCVYLFRTLSIFVTQVTPVNPDLCAPFPDDFDSILKASLDMFSSKTKSCSDMMFSGHSTMISILAMRLWFDSAVGVRGIYRLIIRTIILFVLAFSFTMFIAVRLHYSMDVLIGAGIGLSWSIALENAFNMLPYFYGNGIDVAILRWVESAPESRTSLLMAKIE